MKKLGFCNSKRKHLKTRVIKSPRK